MKKDVRFLIAGCIAVILLIGAFSGGVVAGWFLPHNTPHFQSQPERTGMGTAVAPTSTTSLFEPFWEAWNLVLDRYVDQPVDQTAMMRGAIKGMLEALGDEHTSYLDPDQYSQAMKPMQGEYSGIGATVDTSAEYLTIISPMPGSPAEKAGLKAGDKIIQVDGEDMTGIDGSLVRMRVIGPEGTQVKLTILREGVTEPFDVTLTRARIELKSVEYKMLDGKIGYVYVTTFGDKTTQELTAALKDLMGQNPKGLILDLRYNSGGYLDTAIEVVSQFISDGVVMYEEYGDGTRKSFEALSGGLATKIPLVVLVNEGTASASEITAGAIQDYGRGKLVGVTTYGKGSVQNWVELKDNQGAVRVTIARWLTPKERQIHKIGLEPDVVVELTDDDINANRDPQLDKAIELLSQGQ